MMIGSHLSVHSSTNEDLGGASDFQWVWHAVVCLLVLPAQPQMLLQKHAAIPRQPEQLYDTKILHMMCIQSH